MQGKEFKITESLNSLFTLLLTTLNQLDAIHERKEHHIVEIIWTMMIKNSRVREKHRYSSAKKDQWYESIYIYVNNTAKCDIDCNHAVSLVIQQQSRSLDSKNPIVHYEIIVFADQLMKDVVIRDKISQQHDVMCFEMKMTELSNDFSCVVIQEICDYSNSHKNDEWQGYATATTTSYAKELLQIILRVQVMRSQRAIDVVSSTDECIWTTQQMMKNDRDSFIMKWRIQKWDRFKCKRIEQTLIIYLLEDDNFHVQFQFTNLLIADNFVNWDVKMKKMKRSLLSTKAQSERKIHILHDLRKIEKMQLTIAYARKYQHTYSVIVWVNNNSIDTMLQSLSEFAERANVSEVSISMIKKIQQTLNMRAKTNAVLRWLASKRNQRWLMIFDNVDRDMQSMKVDAQIYNITSFLSSVDHDFILIITRLSSLREIEKSIEVTRLRSDQALKLISNRLSLHRFSSDTIDISSEDQDISWLNDLQTLTSLFNN